MFRRVKIYITLMAIQQIIPALNLMAAERDPFVSILDLEEREKAAAKKTDLSKISLKGIIWNEYKPIAILNDELVMVGDYWQGLKVEAIEKESITLKDQAQAYKLFMEESLPSGAESLATMKFPESEGLNGQEDSAPARGAPEPGREGMFPPPMQAGLPGEAGQPAGLGPQGESAPSAEEAK